MNSRTISERIESNAEWIMVVAIVTECVLAGIALLMAGVGLCLLIIIYGMAVGAL